MSWKWRFPNGCIERAANYDNKLQNLIFETKCEKRAAEKRNVFELFIRGYFCNHNKREDTL